MKRLIRANTEYERISLYKSPRKSDIEGTEWSDNLITEGGKRQGKIKKIVDDIIAMYPELTYVDVDYIPRVGPRGGIKDKWGRDSSFSLIFILYSDIKQIDEIEIEVSFNRMMGQVKGELITRAFMQ